MKHTKKLSKSDSRDDIANLAHKIQHKDHLSTEKVKLRQYEIMLKMEIFNFAHIVW
jgi:hypothetical protein